MSYTKYFLVPPMGESLDSARVVNWLVEPGQAFAAGDILFELETDKSIVEIAADEEGTLIEQLVAKGAALDAQTPAARIEVAGEAPPEQKGDDRHENVPREAAQIEPPMHAQPVQPAWTGAPGERRFATPAARQLARECAIDLATLTGTGPGGRAVLADVAALRSRGAPRDGNGARAVLPGMETLEVATSHGALQAGRWRAAAASPAPTLVLLHGLFGDIDTWAGTIASASRAGLGMVALDLPCHGRSRASVAQFGDIVDAVAQGIGALCDGPVALVGHSLGAAVAVRAAGSLGPRVASLTLFAPAGLGTQIDQSFLDGMLYARTDEALARELGKLTASRAVPSAAFVRELRQRLTARAGALEALCGALSCRGVQQIDVLPDLQALKCPVTIVHGRDDAIIPWQCALNAPPRVALHLVAQAGHMPQAEALALSCEIVERAARI